MTSGGRQHHPREDQNAEGLEYECECRGRRPGAEGGGQSGSRASSADAQRLAVPAQPGGAAGGGVVRALRLGAADRRVERGPAADRRGQQPPLHRLRLDAAAEYLRLV